RAGDFPIQRLPIAGHAVDQRFGIFPGPRFHGVDGPEIIQLFQVGIAREIDAEQELKCALASAAAHVRINHDLTAPLDSSSPAPPWPRPRPCCRPWYPPARWPARSNRW